jgi:hypothetical protein
MNSQAQEKSILAAKSLLTTMEPRWALNPKPSIFEDWTWIPKGK